MEILESTQIMIEAWWFAVSVVALFLFGIITVISAKYRDYIPFIICLILTIITLVIVLFIPAEIPSGKMSYTVEITDPSQYQALVEKGYSFTRLFENKEIYKIVGDILK